MLFKFETLSNSNVTNIIVVMYYSYDKKKSNHELLYFERTYSFYLEVKLVLSNNLFKEDYLHRI